MPRFYLLHHDTGGFDNFSDYPGGIPFEAPAGTEWVEGEPEGLEGHKVVSLADGLAKIFEEQPLEFRAMFAVMKAAVADRIAAGDLEAAKFLVENPQTIIPTLEVPVELKPAQDTMKGELQKRMDNPGMVEAKNVE